MPVTIFSPCKAQPLRWTYMYAALNICFSLNQESSILHSTRCWQSAFVFLPVCPLPAPFLLMPLHDSKSLCHIVPDTSDCTYFGRSLDTSKNGKKPHPGVSPIVGLIATIWISGATQASLVLLPGKRIILYLGTRSFTTAQMKNDKEAC